MLKKEKRTLDSRLLLTDNLETLDLEENWLERELEHQGYKSASEVYLGEYNSGDLIITPYAEKDQ